MEKATLFCIMDGSGSMSHTKKMLSKKYHGMFKGMLEGRYDTVDTKFVVHTTVAREVFNTDEVWYRGESGGTYLSTGVIKALEIINNEIDTDKSDVFALIFSDGDNWGEDNETMVEETRKLCGLCNKVEFLEIKISTYTSTIKNKLDEEVGEPTFESFNIRRKEDVASMLPAMFSQEFGDNKGKSLKAKDQDRMNTYDDILTIARNGRKTIVELKDGSIGVALKHPNDKHNDEIGFQVARLKAEITSKEKQLDYVVGAKKYTIQDFIDSKIAIEVTKDNVTKVLKFIEGNSNVKWGNGGERPTEWKPSCYPTTLHSDCNEMYQLSHGNKKVIQANEIV